MIILVSGTEESRNSAISTVTALAAVSAVRFSQKTLVLPLFYSKDKIDEILNGVNYEKEKSDQRDFTDTGVDGLMRRAISSNIGQMHFNGLCTPMLKGQNMLDIAEGTGRSAFDQESLKNIGSIKLLLRKANEFYNCVFVMVDNDNRELKQAISEVADIHIFCIKQGKPETVHFYDKNKSMIVITNFDGESKFSVNWVKKMYKGVPVKPMPFNIEFRDAKYSQNALSFFIRNESAEGDNPNFEFISALYEIYEEIIENKPDDEEEDEDAVKVTPTEDDLKFEESVLFHRIYEELVDLEEEK